MAYTVEEGDALQERQTILDLWEQGFGGGLEERFTWMYENNPQGVPDTWFLRETDGNIVGSVSLCRMQFSFKGASVRVGQPMDFVIDKGHRSLGPAMSMQRRLIADMQEKGYDLLYGFPNKKSRMVQKRSGFREIGCFSHWRMRLRSESTIRRRLDSKLLARTAGYAVDKGAGLKEALIWRKLPSGYTCQCASEVPLDFDQRCYNRGDFSIMMGGRSRAYLQWRFFQHPLIQNQICILQEGAAVHGYIIYNIEAGRVTVLDFLAFGGSLFLSLLREFVRKMRRAGALSITVNYMGPKNIVDVLRSVGFKEKAEEEYFLVALGQTFQSEHLLEPESWYITTGDRDV